MDSLRPNHFDRGKPFYPLVIHYVSQLIGIKELAIRGLVGAIELDVLTQQMLRKLKIQNPDQSTFNEWRKQLEPIAGPLQLKSEFQDNFITVDIDEIAQDIAQNSTYLFSQQMKAAGGLLIIAHEISKEQPWHDQGELWEFLRHCRNAAAHGGAFALKKGEPRRPARWGKFEISGALQGMPLFKKLDAPGLIFPGDPIRLLWDIEQAYPKMTASVSGPVP